MTYNTQKGITIIDLIAAIAIMGLLFAIIIPGLSKFRDEQALKNTSEDVISLINEARHDTLFSQNSTFYSVHFESTRAVLYTGSTFTEPNSTNKQITFNTAVAIPSVGGINLNGGGSNVTFTRLTGDTSQYGTIIIQLQSNTSRQKTITIRKTGIAS